MTTLSNEKNFEIECENCSTSYDKLEQEPKLLHKCCQKSLCLKCICKIFEADGIFTCPFCNYQDVDKKEGHDFPTNSFILSTMYSIQKKRKLNDESSNENTRASIADETSKQIEEKIISQKSPEKNQNQLEQDQNSYTGIDSHFFRIKTECFAQNTCENSKNLIETNSQDLYSKQEEEKQNINTKIEQEIQNNLPQQTQNKGIKLENGTNRINQSYSRQNSNTSSRSLMESNIQRYFKKNNERFNNGKRKYVFNSENQNNNNSKTQSLIKIEDQPLQYSNTQNEYAQPISKHSKNTFYVKQEEDIQSTAAQLSNNDPKVLNDEQKSELEAQSLMCQNSRGIHSFEKQKNSLNIFQNNQKQQTSNFKNEKLPYPKKELSSRELQDQLQPLIYETMMNQSNSIQDEIAHDKPKFLPMCSTHQLVQTFFCELHSDSYCFKCKSHSFCGENISLIEDITNNKLEELISMNADEKVVVDQLQNLLYHYENINKQIYQFETSKMLNIEKIFSDFIYQFNQKKYHIINELRQQTQTIHQQLKEKTDCIKSTIDKVKNLNNKTLEIKQSINQFSQISSLKNLSNDSYKPTQYSTIKELSKVIDNQQSQIICTIQQFQEQINTLNNQQEQQSKSNESSRGFSESTKQSFKQETNENSNTQVNIDSNSTVINNSKITSNDSNQIKDKQYIHSEFDKFDKFIKAQKNDKYQRKEHYLKKLSLFNVNPKKILQQCYNSTTDILSY